MKSVSNKPYLLYPDYTVGIGITPIQSLKRVVDYNHRSGITPAPEDEPCIIFLLT